MEEKKTYTVVGTVTIGTDEYRDLIESVCEANKETDRMRSQWLEYYNKAQNLEKMLKELQPRHDRLQKFVYSDETISTKYKLWCLEGDTGE